MNQFEKGIGIKRFKCTGSGAGSFNLQRTDLGKAYTIDLLVEEEIIIEAKAVEIMHPVYSAQIITYLKLYDKHLGYLVNFNVPLLKDGFKRIVYQF